jgi:hypothetical protein
LNENRQNIPKQIYSYKNIIEDIIYNEDKIIKIDEYKINKNDFGDLYYLDLLINENKNIMNYSYDKDFIKKIYDSNKNSKDIKKLIISKIIIDLINNYENKYFNKKELNFLEIESMNNIKKYIHALKEYNINITIDELISKRLDEVYKKIIKSLIENIENINFDKVNDLYSVLGFNNIDITNEMTEEILKFIEKNNSNDIILSSKEDIFKEKKMNL